MDKIMPYYVEVKRRQDIPGGWYSIGFNPKTPMKGETRKYELNSVKGLILFTDGFDNLIKLNEEIDSLNNLYRYVEEKGLRTVVKEVRELEKEDSNCKKAPRYKKSDDIAVAKIEEF